MVEQLVKVCGETVEPVIEEGAKQVSNKMAFILGTAVGGTVIGTVLLAKDKVIGFAQKAQKRAVEEQQKPTKEKSKE